MVGIVEILLSLVESFIELKYFHDVATPAPRWFFMASGIGGFHARKESIIDTPSIVSVSVHESHPTISKYFKNRKLSTNESAVM